MIIMTTKIVVKKITGKSITDFMLTCTDQAYQRWWKGVHFAFHTINRLPGDIGNTVVFDELVGKKRFKFSGKVTEVIPGRKLVWQMTKGVKLPGWLILELSDAQDGLEILHTLKMGYQGLGQIFDPLIRLYLSDDFKKALAEHALFEFSQLAEILS